jgi:hypothetical protein
MEEENALRLQSTELSVSCLVDQLPLPVRLEAARNEAEMFRSRERGQAVVISGVSTDKGAACNLDQDARSVRGHAGAPSHANGDTLHARYFLFFTPIGRDVTEKEESGAPDRTEFDMPRSVVWLASLVAKGMVRPTGLEPVTPRSVDSPSTLEIDSEQE